MAKSVFVLTMVLLSSFAVQAQTDLYRRYASQPGVKVASVSNFAIDSTSRVDVTVIEAEDDNGWAWMKKEFSPIRSLSTSRA